MKSAQKCALFPFKKEKHGSKILLDRYYFIGGHFHISHCVHDVKEKMDFPYFICLLYDGRVLKVRALPHKNKKSSFDRFPKSLFPIFDSNFVLFVAANRPPEILKNRWGTFDLIDLDENPELWEEFITRKKKND